MSKQIKKLHCRQDGRCLWCGRFAWRRGSMSKAEARLFYGIDFGAFCSKSELRKRMATIEHIIPKSDGGTNSLANKAMACSECNSARRFRDVQPDNDVVMMLTDEQRRSLKKYQQT